MRLLRDLPSPPAHTQRSVAGASLAATLALAAPAGAATSLQIDEGTLQVTGDAAEQQARSSSTRRANVALDVGADGSTEYTIDRAAFTAVEVKGGGGDDELTVVNAGGALATPITLDGGTGNDTLRGGASRRDADRRLRRRRRRRQPRRRHAPSWAAATTASSGIRATPATPSRARAAPTRSTSTAPTSASRSTSPPTATARAPDPQRRLDHHGPRRRSRRAKVRALGGADAITVGDLTRHRPAGGRRRPPRDTARATARPTP